MGVQLLAKIPRQVRDHAQAFCQGCGHIADRERKLGVKQESGHRRFELPLDGGLGGAARHGLLAFAAMKGSADFADEPGRA